MKPENTCKWVAGLSNGETIIEGVGRFSEKEGELSSWQQLQSYIVKEDLRINSLKVRVYAESGNRDFNLPSNNPKFNGEVPIDFNCERLIRSSISNSKFVAQNYTIKEEDITQKYIKIQAIFPSFIVSLLVDEFDTNQSWISVDLKDK